MQSYHPMLLDNLNVGLIARLLESDNPAIRYRTMTEILEWPVDDPQVCAAQAAIPSFPPVAKLLAAQKPEGYWVQQDYYIPKHYSTFWVLSLLADLGMTAENEHVRRGCEYIFAHQRPDGQFCRRRRIPGHGTIWETQAEPCTQARITRFLIHFGYRSDPHTRAAIEWLLVTQRQDAMWLCNRPGRGCLRATLDFLRAAVLDPLTAAQPATARAASAVCDLLLEPGMGRYHVDEAWAVLTYPYFGYGLISALGALAQLGYSSDHPKVATALKYLLNRRLPDGSWPLDECYPHVPLNFGEAGVSNDWLTLDALPVLKMGKRDFDL